MSILDKFKTKNEPGESFLILGMEERHITGVVAKLSKKEISILGQGESDWDGQTNPSETADIAISIAEKNLKESVLLEKVIFGIPSRFIEKDSIVPKYLEKLKIIAKDLDLKPSGFIEYSQAIAYFIEIKEGSAPTCILLSFGFETITVSLIRVGKVEKSIPVLRSPSFSNDIIQIVSAFQNEILPSRILLYDETRAGSLEKIREELLRFSWHKYSSFLHTPKIESLPQNIGILALVESAGGSMLKTMEEEKQEAQAPVAQPSFGFSKHTQEESVQTTLPTELAKEKIKFSPLPFLKKVISAFQPLHLPSFPSLSPYRIPLLLPFIVIFIAVIFVGGTIFWFYPKSEVKLIVYPLSITRQLMVDFSTNTPILEDRNMVTSTIISENISGEKALATTGKSKVGEPARGEVTLYNKTLASKTFSKGTVITVDALRFTLDQEITIASASDTGEGLTFGKMTTKATAAEIGPEGNIGSGKSFIMKDFPESAFYGKNTEKFSGGSSREVGSVAKTDQDNLLTSLSEELTQKAKQQIMDKVGGEEKILDGSLTQTIKNKKFDKDVGAEAKELNLQLALQISALTYKNSDVVKLAHATSPLEVPPGFKTDPLATTVKINTLKTEKNGDYTASVTINSSYIPTINVSSIQKMVQGKTYQEVKKSISTVDNVAGFEIAEMRTLPFWKDHLPIRTENISITLIPR